MIAPSGSQRKLQTVTIWRYCRGCRRSTPMRKIAGDTIWQCPWCGHREDEAQAAVKVEANGK